MVFADKKNSSDRPSTLPHPPLWVSLSSLSADVELSCKNKTLFRFDVVVSHSPPPPSSFDQNASSDSCGVTESLLQATLVFKHPVWCDSPSLGKWLNHCELPRKISRIFTFNLKWWVCMCGCVQRNPPPHLLHFCCSYSLRFCIVRTLCSFVMCTTMLCIHTFDCVLSDHPPSIESCW